jgi:hypothetical protein
MIIPKTIQETFTFLDVLVDQETKDAIKAKRRKGLVDFLKDLGMFIRNNWLYSDESPLMQGFRSLGMKAYKEEPLALLIIEQYWSHLNGIDFDEDLFMKLLKGESPYE